MDNSTFCLQDLSGSDLEEGDCDMSKAQVASDKTCIDGTGSRDGEEQRNANSDTEGSNSNALECPVCLQTCIYPVQLPCMHIFCFLCVKGVANRSTRCALCRQQIPADFFCQPNLVEWDSLENPVTFDDGYGWFYGGVNGWWQYDERTSQELETHHKAGHASCELLIAGYVYIIDLTNMVQTRRNDRTKKRRIKRDLVTLPGRKGIAGLKINSEGAQPDSDRPGADGHESGGPGRQAIPIQRAVRSSDTQSVSPPTPYNTPQTPQTPSESPPTTTEPDLSVQLERLRLEPLTSQIRGGSSSSSHGYNTPEQLTSSQDDTARLYGVSASLEQYQARENSSAGTSSSGAAVMTDEEDNARNQSCAGSKFV
ncbi:E3 ubiquitin-protein ligase rnf146 [Aplysia californica]|uniref:E3 ubiquitin-protein ligase n=1 Tax=Aplysia californica TaxID=6500 RepID=A0ABM0K383_APLCA|nr:E3 ubiquitin-protein ligase rnf146 [Aplysia californica]